MPLLDLWRTNQNYVKKLTIEQMVTMAGDGNLRDDSDCSLELRQVVSELPSPKLFEHIESCLSRAFQKSGIALQDLVNELGRRLDYQVENGLYQGRSNKIGFDGIWLGNDGHSVVIEVKTTDAYRINLDTIADYRSELIAAGKISRNSSILIVVGRNDTGDIEAQVRGSKHAWDIRLISIDSLQKLVELKEGAGEDETIDKIQSLLVPFEYTRLDNIIDVMFTTAKDVEAGSGETETTETIESEDEEAKTARQEHTPPEVLRHLRAVIVAAISRWLAVNLIAKSRATYWRADKSTRICCSMSKQYKRGYYWYAYHPQWHEFLKQAERGYHVLGCVGRDEAYAIPVDELEKLLPKLNTTETEKGRYYHMILEPSTNGGLRLAVRTGEKAEISQFAIKVGQLTALTSG